MASVTQAGPRSSGWSAFQHGISQLRQFPTQVAHGLQTATRLPVVAAMKARAAAHDLNTHWQGAARNSTPAGAPRNQPSAPGPAVAQSKRLAAKQQFFAENQPQLRSGQYWARQDTSGQWQMVAHESNTLHHLLQAGGSLAQRTQENLYNLVTLPEQLGEFAASPAGEAFRAAPEELLIGLATHALKQAKRLAVDIPSGKAEDDFTKPFRDGSDEQKGAFVADLGLEVALWTPWGKVATGVKMLSGARQLAAAQKLSEGAKLARAGRSADGILVESGVTTAAERTRWSGARELSEYDWDLAEQAYATIRENSEDVGAIALHTGWPQHRVQRVKSHVFEKLHQLDAGPARFDADPLITNAWRRLEAGNHLPKDIQLLEHELFESRFEGIFGVDYRTAHGAANRSGRLSGLEGL